MTIDASPSSATMNAYCQVAFADAYFAFRYGGEDWAGFTDSKKESLIVRATNQLDTWSYGGLRTAELQPLVWPRSGLYNDEGTAYSSATVPVKVQQATCEMALWYWTEEDRYFSDVDLTQLESYKVGPLDVMSKKGALDIPKQVTSLITSMGQGTLLSTGDTSGAKSINMNL